MTDDNLESNTPKLVEENNIIKIIAIVAIAIVLCMCVCLCVLIIMPRLFDPYVGDVMSDVIDDMMLTPIH